MRTNFHSIQCQVLALLLCFLLSHWAAMAQDIGKPGIKILVAPPDGGDPNRTEMIKGEATGVKFDEYRVALFSYADGRWWPQPFLNNQQTRLDNKGKFTAQIHLGTRYAAALVSSSFPPQPAEIFDLPNVGGDVLAMDFADPGETRPDIAEPASATLAEGQTSATSPSVSVGRIFSEQLGVSSPAAVLYEILFLTSLFLRTVLSWLFWMLLIFAGLMFILVLLVLIAAIPAVLVNRTEEFVQAVAASLGAIVNATNRLIGAVEKTIADWMSEETRTKPSWTLIGLICLVIAPAATLADYRLLKFSLEALIPPAADTLWIMAVTLVALKAMIGLLLHTSRRFGMRALLYGLLIISLSCEGWFSFQRTMEIENGSEPSTVQPAADAGSDAKGGLEVNAALLPQNQPTTGINPSDAPAGQPPVEQVETDKTRAWWSWSAIMMALITLVCGVAETIGWWAALALSGKLICWVFFAPVYLPAKLLAWALSGATDDRLVIWAQIELRSVLEWPEKTPVRLRDWKINRALQQGEADRAVLQQTEKTEVAHHHLELARQARVTAKTIEEYRLLYDTINQYELHRHRLDEQKHTFQHLVRLNADWRAHIEVLLKSVLLKMRELFAPIYEQAAASIAEEAKQKVREKVDPVAGQVAATVAEEFRKHASAFSAVDGNYSRGECNETWKDYAANANAGANPQSSHKEEQV